VRRPGATTTLRARPSRIEAAALLPAGATARRSFLPRSPEKSRGFSEEAPGGLDEGAGTHVGGVLNNDIVGATNGSKDVRRAVFCEDDAQTPARSLGLWLDEFIGRDAVRLIFHKDRFGRGGDHLPFLEAGCRPSASPSREKTTAPAPDAARRKRRRVRRSDEVHGLCPARPRARINAEAR